MRRYGRVWLFVAADFFSVALALFCGLSLYACFGAYYPSGILLRLAPVPVLICIINMFSRLYCGNPCYPGFGVSPVEELRRLTISTFSGYAFCWTIFSLTRTAEYFSRIGLGISLIFSLIFIFCFRWLVRRMMKKAGLFQRKAYLAGHDCQLLRQLYRFFDADSYYGIEIAGVFGAGDAEWIRPGCVTGEIDGLADAFPVDNLIVEMNLNENRERFDDWNRIFHNIMIVSEKTVFPVLWSHPVEVGGFGALEISNRTKYHMVIFLKRATEIFFVSLSLAAVLPLFLLLCVAVKISSRGPVFYRAHRLGKGGRPISVLKFRTMYENADERLERILSRRPDMREEWENNFKIRKDPRITPFGALLRRTSIDELPQLINVLRGDMSLIGPRPIVEREVRYYGAYYDLFSSVKPGITGLWQISGRSNLDYADRVRLDVYYIRNWTFWLDFYIFVKTFPAVFFARGAR